MPPQQLLNLALLGDFNTYYLQESHHTQKLKLFTNSFNLSQLVKESTGVLCSGFSKSSSLINLMFVPSNLTSNSCHILPPVSTSNHNSILFLICRSVSASTDLPGPSRRWVYGQADFESANLLLSSIPWDSLLSDSNVN